MDGLSPQACLADKGYDADASLAWLQEKGIKAFIPPKSNRKEQRDSDYWHYKERHVVECLFGKLKYFRRIAMHYEKKPIHFMEMLAFATTLLWLR
jgi:transposase